MSDYSLTVDRQKLKDLLQERLDQVKVNYDLQIQQANEELALSSDLTQAVKSWYENVLFPRVDAGEVRWEPTGGSRGQGGWVATPGTPSAFDTRPKPTDQSVLKDKLVLAQRNRERTVAQLETAINLLNITATDTVEIPVSEYERMLKLGTSGLDLY